MTLCDTHIHVVGDPDAYPLIAARTYTPGLAAIEDVQRLGAPYDITRFVIVQPSFYGTDNTLLVEALAKLGPLGRGVAVVDPATATDAELDTLALAGVCGLRINLYSTHGAVQRSPAERFAAVAGLAKTRGWHVQVIAPLPILAGLADQLAASPVPVVLDHYGLPGGTCLDHPDRTRLLGLLRHDHGLGEIVCPVSIHG